MNDSTVFSSTPEPRGGRVSFGPDDRGFVYAVARRIVRSAEDAEDVAQEAMLLAYRHRDSFRGDAHYRTWLYRIASTAALSHLRRARRSREDLAANDQGFGRELADPARSPEGDVADREAAEVARRAIAALEPMYRAAFELRAADCPEAEIAEHLGISVANVKIRVHRARKRLREQLHAHVA